jgi:hypothetical protein
MRYFIGTLLLVGIVCALALVASQGKSAIHTQKPLPAISSAPATTAVPTRTEKKAELPRQVRTPILLSTGEVEFPDDEGPSIAVEISPTGFTPTLGYCHGYEDSSYFAEGTEVPTLDFEFKGGGFGATGIPHGGAKPSTED